MDNTYTVYVQTDTNGNITAVNSSAFLSDTTGWIKIDEGTGDKYHHAQGNYFDKPIMTMSGTYRHKLVDGVIVEKSNSEIKGEEVAAVSPPTIEERTTALEATQSDVIDVLASALGVTI